MPDATSPPGWLSFADYLGLNEDALRELEQQAADRAAAAQDKADAAFGNAYQQANAEISKGGAGDLTTQTGYMDFVKAQREAEEAAALTGANMSPEELAARGVLRQGAPVAPKRNVAGAQTQLDEAAKARDAGKAAQKAYADKLAAEKAAQDAAFNKSKDAVLAQLEGRQRDAVFYGSDQSGPKKDAQVLKTANDAGFSGVGARPIGKRPGSGYQGYLQTTINRVKGYGK